MSSFDENFDKINWDDYKPEVKISNKKNKKSSHESISDDYGRNSPFDPTQGVTTRIPIIKDRNTGRILN